jgi:(5-formylfuran-3-yl)methyl phosphate synthase
MTPQPGLPRGLLVSVRSPEEAIEAVAGGAAIIDVKEPAHGALGRAGAERTAAILAAAASCPCTLACGELAEGIEAIVAHVARVTSLVTDASPPAAGPVAVKAGPAGLGLAGWRRAFMRLARDLPTSVAPVAVAYADADAALAPDPLEIIDAAAGAGATTILIDTFSKAGPGLVAVAAVEGIANWVERARAAGLAVALAGRLTAADVAAVASLGADIVGVRSAACGGDRLGRVERGNVARIAGTLSAGREVSAAVTGRTVT